MHRLLLRAVTAVLLLAAAACAKPEPDPIQLDGMRVTVDNRTDQDWTDVEIWINRQFRQKAPKLQKGQRLQTQLDSFVTAYGRRFEFNRLQITDLRVNAKSADGTPVEIRKQFSGDKLSDALKGIGGKR